MLAGLLVFTAAKVVYALRVSYATLTQRLWFHIGIVFVWQPGYVRQRYVESMTRAVLPAGTDAATPRRHSGG